MDITLKNFKDFHTEEFKKSNNLLAKLLSNYSKRELKIINALIWIFNTTYTTQLKNEDNIDLLFKRFINETTEDEEKYYVIDFSNFIQLLNSERNITRKNLGDSLEKIRSNGIIYHKHLDNIHEMVGTSFIQKWKIETDTQTTKTKIKIKIDKAFYEDLFEFNKRGFTVLSIKSNLLKSKFSIILYEELMRIKKLRYIYKQKNTHEKSIQHLKNIWKYDINECNKMFETNNKYISKFKDKILKAYDELIKLNLIDTEEMTFHFKFEKREMIINIDRNNEDTYMKEKKINSIINKFKFGIYKTPDFKIDTKKD